MFKFEQLASASAPHNMDPRTMPTTQFPYYPFSTVGSSAKGQSLLGSPTYPLQGAPFMASQQHQYPQQHVIPQHQLQQRQPQQQQAQLWSLNAPSNSAGTTPSYLSTAYQTALLLARLHQQSSERQVQANSNNVIPVASDLTMTSPSKPLLSGSGSHQDGHQRPSIEQKKRSSSSESESGRKTLKYSSASTDSDDSSSDKDNQKATSLRGERRLVIAFENLGTKGQFPQTFGKSGALVPDGVSGTHTVYNERWKFEISHAKESFTVERMKCVCLTWTITNLNTGIVTSITETKDEAVIRNSQGQTISNKAFREALETRAKDLERRLQEETNAKRITQLEALVRGLRPKRFSEGPLIFGLQHKVVQDKMMEALA